MVFKCIDAEKLYAKDPKLKKEDVQILQEWLKKQPHLPQLEETQLILALHSCYYRIESAKTAIDNYFTVRTHCPDLFESLNEENTLRTALSFGFAKVLPKRTPEDYSIFLVKLIDFKTENFNTVHFINIVDMVYILNLHQTIMASGVILVYDLRGFSLGHLTKLNLTAMRQVLFHIQEGVPVRIKQIHILNAPLFTDKLMAMLTPFIKNEFYKMLQFHPAVETFYEQVPKYYLPKDYDGELPSCEELQADTLKDLLENFDFFKWQNSQKVDESKRFGRPKNVSTIFGVDGTFKKLEID
ncbi:alpha-tocopherol transfer protein-like isoform X1 [Tenebrio molitor]|uniref:CRAL-TRIO domain-containing protein n=1 Tax=Tenebrio molitor TaxID=7067 RepID=A0A8J6LBU7_TENMO|nr:hypothetical protein GEV33_007969 [Tenebrio molitor]